MKLTCIIVDDEPVARKLLEEYIGDIDFLQLVGKAENPLKADSILRSTGVDLLFLGRPAMAGLGQGRRCRAVGTAANRGHRAVLWNPRYWLEPSGTVPASRDDAGPGSPGLFLVTPLARIQP